MDFIYSKIFKCAYENFFQDGKLQKIYGDFDKLYELEQTLEDFIYAVIGFRFSKKYDYSEIRAYFDNICQNIKFSDFNSLIEAINEYKDQYLQLMELHPNLMLFIEAIKRIYSPDYDGKLGFNISNQYKDEIGHQATINHQGKMMVISKHQENSQDMLPDIIINDIDKFEDALLEYVEAIKFSDNFYNIFNNEHFNFFTYNEKVKMILEATILNASSYELANPVLFFNKYRDFVLDNTLPRMKQLQKVGTAFNDEMYFASKKSSIEYETPYYLSFMLKNSYYEFPNIRLGITEEDDKKKAHIIAVQSSQHTPNNITVSQTIKDNTPKSSKFRFVNPDGLISILMAFGLLNGLGIKDVSIGDYMPIRCHKTIRDKGMNTDEGHKYIERIYDKEIYTYLKLSEICQGIDITNFMGDGFNMNIELADEIICPNEFLQNLYDLAYNLGKTYALEESITRN